MNELYLLGGALVGAGAYIMYLHREIKLYQQDVQVLSFVLSTVEGMLKEESNAEKEGD
jgi:hypothetical protein